MGNSTEQERAVPPFKKAANDKQGNESSDKSAKAEDNKFFALAHSQTDPAGFKIIFAAGNIAAFYYHDIISPVTFDGSGIIELNTPSITVKITGKNLATLFDQLFEARVAWIKEPDTSFVQSGEGQPEIESINIENLFSQAEKKR